MRDPAYRGDRLDDAEGTVASFGSIRREGTLDAWGATPGFISRDACMRILAVLAAVLTTSACAIPESDALAKTGKQAKGHYLFGFCGQYQQGDNGVEISDEDSSFALTYGERGGNVMDVYVEAPWAVNASLSGKGVKTQNFIELVSRANAPRNGSQERSALTDIKLLYRCEGERYPEPVTVWTDSLLNSDDSPSQILFYGTGTVYDPESNDPPSTQDVVMAVYPNPVTDLEQVTRDQGPGNIAAFQFVRGTSTNTTFCQRKPNNIAHVSNQVDILAELRDPQDRGILVASASDMIPVSESSEQDPKAAACAVARGIMREQHARGNPEPLAVVKRYECNEYNNTRASIGTPSTSSLALLNNGSIVYRGRVKEPGSRSAYPTELVLDRHAEAEATYRNAANASVARVHVETSGRFKPGRDALGSRDFSDYVPTALSYASSGGPLDTAKDYLGRIGSSGASPTPNTLTITATHAGETLNLETECRGEVYAAMLEQAATLAGLNQENGTFVAQTEAPY